MNNVYQNIMLNLSNAIINKTKSSNGQISWLVIVDEVEDKSAKARVIINAIEDLSIDFLIDPDEYEKFGKKAATALKNQGGLATLNVIGMLNETININLEEEDGIWRVVKVDSNIYNNSTGEDYNITPIAFSIGGTQFQELKSQFDHIESVVKKKVAETLKDRFVIDNIAFKSNERFISPVDIQNAEKLRDQSDILEDLALSNASYVNELKAIPVYKKEADAENPENIDAIHYKEILRRVEQVYVDTYNTFVDLQSLSNRFRSADVRQSLGMTSNTYFKDIKENLLNIDGQITSHDESAMFLPDADLEDNHLNFLNEVNINFKEISDKCKSLSEHYNTFARQD